MKSNFIKDSNYLTDEAASPRIGFSQSGSRFPPHPSGFRSLLYSPTAPGFKTKNPRLLMLQRHFQTSQFLRVSNVNNAFPSAGASRWPPPHVHLSQRLGQFCPSQKPSSSSQGWRSGWHSTNAVCAYTCPAGNESVSLCVS